eukprot:7246949-Prymnesium_polylepis.1
MTTVTAVLLTVALGAPLQHLRRAHTAPRAANVECGATSCAEAHTLSLVDDDKKAFSQLADFVVTEGGFVGPVTMETVGGLRGLRVTSDVTAGEPLLAVPRHCMLHATEGDA